MKILVFLPLFLFSTWLHAQYEGTYFGIHTGLVLPGGDFDGLFKPGFETGLYGYNHSGTFTFGYRVSYLRLAPADAYAAQPGSSSYLQPFQGGVLSLSSLLHLFSDDGYRKFYPLLGLSIAYQYLELAGTDGSSEFSEFGRYGAAPVGGLNYNVTDNFAVRLLYEHTFSFGGSQGSGGLAVGSVATLPALNLLVGYRFKPR